MGLAQSLEKVASNVIDALGADVTIRYVTVEAISQREVNDLVQASDKRLIVAAKELATAPETKDRVVISSVVHQIIQVQTIDQDNTAITYELVLRA